MHAATVDLMMKKARFESDTALAVAEAFDIAIQQAQLVTVPMLDLRFSEFQAAMDARFADSRTYADERFAKIEARFIEHEAKIDARFAEFRSDLDEKFAKIDTRFLALETRVTSLEVKMDACFALQEALFDKKLEAR
jgi:hypothetical protein